MSQFQTCPTNHSWTGVTQIMKFLKRTRDYRLDLSARLDVNGDLKAELWCDSDLGGEQERQRSTTGIAIYVGGVLVGWKSNIQRESVRASTIAELSAFAQGCETARWVRLFLRELGYPQKLPTKIGEDNKGCVDIVRASAGTKKSRMVALMEAGVRDAVDGGHVVVEQVVTKDQRADVFTKGLPKILHQEAMAVLGIRKK
jgi:hypothetical protein